MFAPLGPLSAKQIQGLLRTVTSTALRSRHLLRHIPLSITLSRAGAVYGLAMLADGKIPKMAEIKVKEKKGQRLTVCARCMADSQLKKMKGGSSREQLNIIALRPMRTRH